jgi:hypothetical protein
MDTGAIILCVFFGLVFLIAFIDTMRDYKHRSYWVCYYNSVPEFAREELNSKCTRRKNDGSFRYKECEKCPYRDKSKDKI